MTHRNDSVIPNDSVMIHDDPHVRALDSLGQVDGKLHDVTGSRCHNGVT
jgi:hypothetical protein